MSKKQIFIGAGVIVALGLATVVAFRSVGPGKANAATAKVLISSAHAYLIENGGRVRELATGDTITVPAIIETDALGKASVFFADGSVARLDGGTRVALRESVYDAKNGKLVVHIALTVGRVWSKIIRLATPDSVWEVETSRAVATVRGSAFGAANDTRRSTFIGSEHTVDITPIDPKTGQPLRDETKSLGEDKFVVVTDSDAASAVKGDWQANIQDVSTDTANADWVNENESADADQDNALSGLEDLAPRERTKRLLESFGIPTDDGPGVDGSPKDSTGDASGATSANNPPRDGTFGSTTTPPVGGGNIGVRATALLVAPASPLLNLVEGEKVLFSAVVKFSDGTTREATKDAAWRVLGPIGSFSAPGVFLPLLDPSVSEFGEGSGAIVAVWKDPSTGAEFLGKTSIFTVKARVEIIPAEG